METNGKYTLLECELITGKTHQIRFSLAKNNTPIIGDRKYGDKNTNRLVKDKLKINNQVLLAYKLNFEDIDNLEYLAGKSFESNKTKDILKLKEKVFKL